VIELQHIGLFLLVVAVVLLFTKAVQ